MNEGSGQAARPDLASALQQIERLATLLSPIALATALLYYFGWVRSVVQARALGYDAALSTFSTEDYLLKSVNILFIPLIGLLIVAAALVALDRAVVRAARRRPRLRAVLLRMATLFSVLWIGLPPVVLLVTVARRTIGVSAALPLALTVSMLGILYGDSLRRRLAADTEPAPGPDRTKPPIGLGRPARIVVLALLVLAVFWDVERLARVLGMGYASELVAHPGQLTSVTVFSSKSLTVADQCVSETPLNPGGMYGFRYDGLRLIDVSDQKIYLISICAGRSRVVTLEEGENLRMEFLPGAENAAGLEIR